ncbi:MAG: hypothetical protein K0S28_1674 [Paucimonas sp.]|jgi:hypothetical protein|nr:hypothetical protein [Paucimonas sp.]
MVLLLGLLKTAWRAGLLHVLGANLGRRVNRLQNESIIHLILFWSNFGIVDDGKKNAAFRAIP